MLFFYDMDLPDLSGGGGPGGPTNKAASTTPTPAPVLPNIIPKPDYNDPQSRLTFAQNWTKQYGPLMQGRGDTPLRVNEVPEYGSDTAKNMSIKAASKLGIDPALLYSSSMEEGMSGLYKDKDGNISTDATTTDKYPVTGYGNFGLDTFSDKVQGLVKKGYLPPDFAKNFSKVVQVNEKGEKVNSANFIDTDSALQAKAATLKDTYDDIDSYAKQRKIALSPKARDFFALANYNGGEGVGHQMLNDYYNNGYLEGDKFLDKRPTSGQGLSDKSYKAVYENVARRTQMAQALKEQKLF